MKKAINNRRTNLQEALQHSVGHFKTKMLDAELITKKIEPDASSVTVTIILDEFVAGLNFETDVQRLDRRCYKFLEVLEEIGGPAESAAKYLREWLSLTKPESEGQ